MKKQLQEHLQKRCQEYVDDSTSLSCTKVKLKSNLFQKRNAQIVYVKARGTIRSHHSADERSSVNYTIHWQFFIKQNQKFYIEEEMEERKAYFDRETLVEDEEVILLFSEEQSSAKWRKDTDLRIPFYYDRLRAVQYAETWWNEFNPSFEMFENDCTNFISQCLLAGEAPMRGAPNRSAGWWYNRNNWSYSWAVAHAFFLYLSNSKTGLKAIEVDSPEKLLLGDVICYDFEGDGRFNHTTIVTGKDAEGMPLVNAHTTNSRLRYWSYEDSTAYTPNIQYRFFTIVGDE